MPIFACEKSVKSWVKSKDFEIHPPFSGVGDPSKFSKTLSKHDIIQYIVENPD